MLKTGGRVVTGNRLKLSYKAPQLAKVPLQNMYIKGEAESPMHPCPIILSLIYFICIHKIYKCVYKFTLYLFIYCILPYEFRGSPTFPLDYYCARTLSCFSQSPSTAHGISQVCFWEHHSHLTINLLEKKYFKDPEIFIYSKINKLFS